MSVLGELLSPDPTAKVVNGSPNARCTPTTADTASCGYLSTRAPSHADLAPTSPQSPQDLTKLFEEEHDCALHDVVAGEMSRQVVHEATGFYFQAGNSSELPDVAVQTQALDTQWARDPWDIVSCEMADAFARSLSEDCGLICPQRQATASTAEPSQPLPPPSPPPLLPLRASALEALDRMVPPCGSSSWCKATMSHKSDVESVQSFGLRSEAMPSLAAVAAIKDEALRAIFLEELQVLSQATQSLKKFSVRGLDAAACGFSYVPTGTTRSTCSVDSFTTRAMEDACHHDEMSEELIEHFHRLCFDQAPRRE